ncbi:MAG: hypothetical protein SOT60_00140 [Bilifractor sp.]|nr:hypothetical protein [Lachnospiraceae bacterium]MDY2836339.1 hypothetical protein [Bilifractor sp.]
MKEKKSYRKLMVKASALVLSAFMAAAAAPPVWADDTQVVTNLSVTSATEEDHDCTIELVDSDGNILETSYANEGDTYGPEGTVYVGYSCYAGGKVYQSVNNDYQGTVGSGETEITIKYKEVGEPTEDSTIYILASDTNAIIGQVSDENDLPEDVVTGDVTYEKNSAKVETDANGSSVIKYTPAKNSKKPSVVTIKYIATDDNGVEQVLAERNVSTTLLEFIAPRVFSRSSDGKVKYYKAAGKTTIDLQKDITEPITVEYKEVTGEYDWYIFLYSSQTNKCIDVKKVKVTPAETGNAAATYLAEDSITVDGKKYTRNKAFDAEYTHDYNDSNHSTYIYYDPEGYNNSSELQTKKINIRYVDIATGNTLQSISKEIKSDKNTMLVFPDSIDVAGVHYLRVAGQVAYVDHNFYSPKELYTVYYYDENNTQFHTHVITTEEIQEIEVINGGTTYRVIPGITRTIVTNTDNGVSTVLSTNDSTGAAIAASPIDNGQAENESADDGSSEKTAANGTSAAATSSDSTSEEDTSSGVSIDGIEADEIQTPESNIRLDEKKDSKAAVRNTVFLVIGIAAIIAIVVAAGILIRRKRMNRS